MVIFAVHSCDIAQCTNVGKRGADRCIFQADGNCGLGLQSQSLNRKRDGTLGNELGTGSGHLTRANHERRRHGGGGAAGLRQRLHGSVFSEQP